MYKFHYDVVKYLADSGIEESMKQMITEILSYGCDGASPEQIETMLRYLNKLADKGDPTALQTLGALYYTGVGDIIHQDYSKAIYFYEKSAELSELTDHWALNNLGYCYYYGRSVEIDYKKAYSCFALSATYNNPNAMYKLGDMYYYGHYVKKDLEASCYWYLRAKAEYPEADYDYQDFLIASIAMRVGRAYLYGEGIEEDLIAALMELRLAEALFYKQVLISDEFSVNQLPKVKSLIKIALDKLDVLLE